MVARRVEKAPAPVEVASVDVPELEEPDTEEGAGDEGEPEVAAPKASIFVVAPGRAITCRRGILANGEEIRPRDLADGELGQECLVELVETGHVVMSEG